MKTFGSLPTTFKIPALVNSNNSGRNLILDERNNYSVTANFTPDKINYTTNYTHKSKVIPKIAAINQSPAFTPLDVQNPKLYGHYNDLNNISSDVAKAIDNYQFLYDSAFYDTIIKPTADKDGNKLGLLFEFATAPSLFNPYYGVNLSGALDYKKEEINVSVKKLNGSNEQTFKIQPHMSNLTDCRTSKLIADSNKIDPATGLSTVLGAEKYKWADFLFCTDLGKSISNNRLITLRKFTSPVTDNIKEETSFWDQKTYSIPPEAGRMVCWLNDTNKLEDILKYSFKTKWEEMKSEIEQLDSQEENGKLLNSIVNLGSSQNLSLMKKGYGSMNSNKILNFGASMFGGENNSSGVLGLSNDGPYSAETLRNYDKHRIYEPQDTIRAVYKYDGELTFSQDISLVFDYTMRSYSHINTKAAFLDLLANILTVTYRPGHFWGGEQKIVGVQPNKRGWAAANGIIDNAIDTTFGALGALMKGEVNMDSFLGAMGNALSGFGGGIDGLLDKGKDFIKGIPDSSAFKNSKEIFSSMIKNKLGRPGLYAFQSLLSGDPVGLWHLTIGNPYNPILSIGNLIMDENTTIEHYGPLGIDDFPTGLRVTVKLKHAVARDAIKIQQMYTDGRRTIYAPLGGGITDIANYLDSTAEEQKKVSTVIAQ